ncbi:hypothetical protein EUTSA_v10017025mg [Eutrema salsugineum]|uniref:NAD(P)-binding domain-containing protein n=1 Tax=Eutrema salsugineum TaxID=72664 RepID=V4M704_EUTSA|nr:uncharacterized protein At2g34460, chloroplastic [Eutrema salsugineum]ESQ52044.1 hypothetical protein EUTSA_v10017025mg [Eutrema salsugineum]
MATSLLLRHSSAVFFSKSSLFFTKNNSSRSVTSIKMERGEASEVITEKTGEGNAAKKMVFVAGATGKTGKRIVEQLLSHGFAVKAGVRDVEKAKTSFKDDPSLQIVRADVTEGPEKLAEAIGDDSKAVICASGFRPGFDLFAPWKVDNFGTVNLVDACRKQGVDRFVLISSILVNGAAMGQILNPAYIFLNVFGLTLVAKLQAEKYIKRSGINYTIVRPGGLKNDPPTGNVVMEPEDTLSTGSISRDQVAEVAVEALLNEESSFKVVEIVARPDAPKLSYKDLFASVKGGN